MSRCFPFPPPGYVLNGVRDEALIESIKRAEEKAKKEQRRKERKGENKDKKDKKDKKEKKRKEREGESEKHSHKRRRKEEVAKDGKNSKKVESENGCLEKSGLTVERDLLQSTSQNSCDSTLNSNELLHKQKKEKQPHINNHNDSESIIRIRLPIRRQNDPEAVMMTTNKDHQKPCPSREIKVETVKSVTREQQPPCFTSKPLEEKRKDQIFTTKLPKEKKLSSTSDPSSGLCKLCPPSLAVQFLNVVENWVPNTIERRVEELTNSEDDECWWFLKKPSSHKFDVTERCKQLYRNDETKQVMCSSMAWPCARLLPEADVHALPYTAPF